MTGLRFRRYIGIDYSGAKTPTNRLKGLQVFETTPGELPFPARPQDAGKNWSRKAIAHWLLEQVTAGERVIVGIDHGFSFPQAYFERYGLASWDEFLTDFGRYWPTDSNHCYVDFVRDGAVWETQPKPPRERVGQNTEYRLTERWTSSAKSVFHFDVQGSVAKSTHAGIPWLRFLRDNAGERTVFWPFDGWQPIRGASLIVEIYPSLFRNRYPREGRSGDEQDAYAVARWLEEMDRRGVLGEYFNPPLTLAERRVAEMEGWILGVT